MLSGVSGVSGLKRATVSTAGAGAKEWRLLNAPPTAPMVSAISSEAPIATLANLCLMLIFVRYSPFDIDVERRRRILGFEAGDHRRPYTQARMGREIAHSKKNSVGSNASTL